MTFPDLCESSKTQSDNSINRDVVLVQAPGWGIWTPPLALAMLTAFLRKHGYKVLPLDLNIEFYLKREDKYKNTWELEQSLWFWETSSRVNELIEDKKELIDKFLSIIMGTGVKVVGFTIYGSSLHISLHLAKQIKMLNPQIKIVFGGPHVSRFMAGKSVVRDSSVDFVVQGEGELTLLDIVQKTRAGETIDCCPGTLLLKNNKVMDCGDRPLIDDLNTLPLPDFSDYDFQKYRDSFKLPIMSSRGCLNRCIYCNERSYWRKYRYLKADRLFGEIKEQLSRYPFIDWIDFQDSLVNGSIKELERLADLIIESGTTIRWSGQAAIRKELTYALLCKLKKSGCICLAYGIETPSTSLMLKIGKVLSRGANPDQIVRDGHRAGLSCAYNFMFGLPGETETDAQETLEFLKRNKDFIATVNPSPSFCGFCPGTLGHEHPEEYGIDASKGDLYWQTKDGKNDYLIRLKRFEEFCEVVQELGIPTTYPSRKLLDRDRTIGNYYYVSRGYSKAAPYFEGWLRENPDDKDVLRKLEHCYECIVMNV